MVMADWSGSPAPMPKAGRDTFVAWIRAAGLEFDVDRIGNIFGIWRTADNPGEAPILPGSHIDTVIYDGLSALKVIQILKAFGLTPRPIDCGSSLHQ
jgi:N-carbamoyl-L-amino-acid hydrolase